AADVKPFFSRVGSTVHSDRLSERLVWLLTVVNDVEGRRTIEAISPHDAHARVSVGAVRPQDSRIQLFTRSAESDRDVQRLGASGNNCVERPGIASVCRHEIWSKAPAHWVRSKCGSDDMTGIAGIYRDHRFAVLVGLEAKRPGNHVDDQDSGCRSAA